jgi:sorting nexin-29
MWRETTCKKLRELIRVIWREEKMPEDWESGIICSIFKKADKLDCNNYRDITLLDIAYKVFSNVLNKRLKKFTENLLGEYQCGVRKNRSTPHQIYIIRQIMEKHYEHNQDLHILFVDFKQAFDSIDRYKVYQVTT